MEGAHVLFCFFFFFRSDATGGEFPGSFSRGKNLRDVRARLDRRLCLAGLFALLILFDIFLSFTKFLSLPFYFVFDFILYFSLSYVLYFFVYNAIVCHALKGTPVPERVRFNIKPFLSFFFLILSLSLPLSFADGDYDNFDGAI